MSISWKIDEIAIQIQIPARRTHRTSKARKRDANCNVENDEGVIIDGYYLWLLSVLFSNLCALNHYCPARGEWQQAVLLLCQSTVSHIATRKRETKWKNKPEERTNERKSMAIWFYFELYRYAHLYTHESNDRWMSIEISEWSRMERWWRRPSPLPPATTRITKEELFSPPFNINFVLKNHLSVTLPFSIGLWQWTSTIPLYCRSHLWSHLHRIFPHFSLSHYCCHPAASPSLCHHFMCGCVYAPVSHVRRNKIT